MKLLLLGLQDQLTPTDRSSRSSRLSPDAMARNENERTQSESRKRKTETVVEYEAKKKAPPVVRAVSNNSPMFHA